jgi:RhtB (resistance to homoserine/threonine) family protein
MHFPAQWATVFVVGVFAVTSPGPDMLVTLRSSLVGSTRAGLFTALGIGLGLCFHTGYSLVGLAVLISRSILLFDALKLVGAAYLIYVGWRSLRARPGSLAGGAAEDDAAIEDPDLPRHLTPRAAFTAGLLTNLTNPKVTLFFLALFTQVIEPDTTAALRALYGGTIIAISLTWFGFLAVVVGRAAVRRRLNAVGHWVERVAGTLFIALGLRLAFSRASG